MISVAESVAHAWTCHQAGDLPSAAHNYRLALQADPANADVWYLYGLACHALGQGGEARAAYERVLQLRPDHADACNQAGMLLAGAGRFAEATEYFRRAAALQPGRPEFLNNLGVALSGAGSLAEAEACYRAAVRLRPAYAEAHNNLGFALTAQGRAEEAVASCRQALALVPAYAEAHNNLGNALRRLERYAEAEACYHEALRLKPNFLDARHNLAVALAAQDRLEEAVTNYQAVLRCRPDHAEAYNNLGASLQELGKLDEAVTAYRQAISLRPDYAGAHASLSLALLLQGNFREGWPELEWRLQRWARSFSRPLWDGSPLPDHTILLYYRELGLGDTFQFICYAPLVKQRVGRVVVEAPPGLGAILSTCPGVDQVVEEGTEPPPYDVYAPQLRLPIIFGTTLTNVPANVPYLSADPVLVARWRQRLAGLPGFKIGIAWEASRKHPGSRPRCIPLRQFAPLARLPGVRLISLQKGGGLDQLAGVAEDFPVTSFGDELDQTAGAFMDTAAIMKNLDLVISADTSVVHLAGALGVRAWVPLPQVPDWRWLLHRQGTPWYPTLRLFRQSVRGQWEDVFDRLVVELNLGRVASG
jgi:tetratricopeptide (TPR) repeat protein